MQRFFIRKHGLLWLVMEYIETDDGFMSVEDSAWECEDKAKQHCYILNKEHHSTTR
jgi:hypothetical protein